jgi:putative ABC transport system ATP-binding protein
MNQPGDWRPYQQQEDVSVISLLQSSSVGKTLIGSDKSISADAWVIDIRDLLFSWNSKSLPLLNIPILQVDRGERVFVQGASGSGKSTLLSLLSGILTAQQGSVSILGKRIDAMTGPQRDRFRADHMGVIFQMFNLIPYLTVVENVTLPCRFSCLRREKAVRSSGTVEAEARRLLSHLNMDHPDLLSRPVTELSVGQQQRVAAARALMGAPELIIADEPTSSLDAGHRQSFIRLVFEECEKALSTLIFVGHDRSLASLFDRTIQLTAINRAGRATSDHGGEVR